MSYSIASRSRSQDSGCAHLIGCFFYRFFCVNVYVKCFSPGRRTRLLIIVDASRHFRSFPYRITTIAVIIIIPFMPFNVNFRYFNDDRLRNTRRSTICVALRFRCPLCGLYVKYRRASAPTQRVITLARKIRFSTAVFDSQCTRGAREAVVRSRTMEIIIRCGGAFAANRVCRAFVRLRNNVNSYQRIKVINPRRFCTARVRLFRFVRIKRPTNVFFRVMVCSFYARSFTR